MSQKMLIDASHNEETRVVVLESKKVEDFDFESLKKLQLSGNIYLAKVTRVEPSLQAAFLDYGGNRHGFLAFSEIHPDYYQIPLEERIRSETEQKPQGNKNTKSRKVKRNQGLDDQTLPEEVSKAEKLVSDAVFNEEEQLVSSEIENDLESDEISNLESENSKVEDSNVEETAFKRQHRKFRIQEVIKVRQILLIQIVKEERGNKGAALTTYLSLAGRYCVLMPNTPRGGGISRKITNLADRKKLKEIANSLLVPDGSGLIIRTAGSNRTKLEIKRDYEYLIRQWEQVRDLTLSSIAPTTIYEEGSLIKRAIRDLYSRNIGEILVEGDRGYKEAKDYMKMLMPSHAKNVKKYEQSVPLFTKYQVEDHLAAMFNPIAQLKSGGYIVINVTEALVAVDVNSGRATKETSIEDTALKTNLEAADELARQIKLRDLAGLIVIDFIDMEDRKNNIAVEKRMKDRLKNDRARTQVGRISIFGLLEMSRQRLRPGMIETSTQACSHCHGTGITRSDDSLSLAILRELEEEGIKNIYSSLNLQTPINIANYMLNEKRERISTIEERYNLSIKIEALTYLISPEYKLEKIRSSAITSSQNNSGKIDETRGPDELIDSNSTEMGSIEAVKEEVTTEDNQNKRRRRRRRKPKARVPNNPADIHTEPNEVNSSAKNSNLDTVNNLDENLKLNDSSEADLLQAGPENKKRPSVKTTEKKLSKTAPKTEKATKKISPARKEKNVKAKPKRTATAKTLTEEKIISDEKIISKDTKEKTSVSKISQLEEPTVKKRGWWSARKKS